MVLRLPSLPPSGPGADESLESYIERCARLLRSSPEALVKRVGIDADPTGLSSRLLWPTPGHVAAWAVGLDLSPQIIESMTLRRYTLPLSLPQTISPEELGRLAAQRWIFVAGSRYCTRCLDETGQWRIDWRLPLNTRCSRHGLLLRDSCPSCGGWPRSGHDNTASARSFQGEWRDPTRCYLSQHFSSRGTGRAAMPCGADLSTPHSDPIAASAADGRIAAAIAGRDTTLLGRTTSSGEALSLWRELTTLSAWLTHTRDQLKPRPLRSAPRSAGTARRLVATSIQVLSADSAAEGADQLLRIARTAGIEPDRHWFRDRLPKQPTPAMAQLVEVALSQSGRFSTRITRTRPQDPLWGYTADQLPQRFWACGIPETLRHVARLSDPAKQAFTSLCLARLLAGTWTDGALALGWVPASGRTRSRNAIGKTPPEHRAALLRQVAELARRMDRCPPTVTFRDKRTDPSASLASMYTPPCGRGWCPCPAQVGATESPTSVSANEWPTYECHWSTSSTVSTALDTRAVNNTQAADQQKRQPHEP